MYLNLGKSTTYETGTAVSSCNIPRARAAAPAESIRVRVVAADDYILDDADPAAWG